MNQEARVFDINMMYIKKTIFYQLYNPWSQTEHILYRPLIWTHDLNFETRGSPPNELVFFTWLYYFLTFSWFIDSLLFSFPLFL